MLQLLLKYTLIALVIVWPAVNGLIKLIVLRMN